MQRKRVTLATRQGYALPAGGKRRTLKLKLTNLAKALLRTRAHFQVEVRVATRDAETVTKIVTRRR